MLSFCALMTGAKCTYSDIVCEAAPPAGLMENCQHWSQWPVMSHKQQHPHRQSKSPLLPSNLGCRNKVWRNLTKKGVFISPTCVTQTRKWLRRKIVIRYPKTTDTLTHGCCVKVFLNSSLKKFYFFWIMQKGPNAHSQFESCVQLCVTQPKVMNEDVSARIWCGTTGDQHPKNMNR